MSIFGEINSVNEKHALIFISIVALLSPGVGALLIYFPTEFAGFDIFKILLICMSFSVSSILPLFLAMVITNSNRRQGTNETSDEAVILFMACSFLICFLGIALQIVSFLFHISFSAYIFVHAVLCIAIPVLAVYNHQKLSKQLIQK